MDLEIRNKRWRGRIHIYTKQKNEDIINRLDGKIEQRGYPVIKSCRTCLYSDVCESKVSCEHYCSVLENYISFEDWTEKQIEYKNYIRDWYEYVSEFDT